MLKSYISLFLLLTIILVTYNRAESQQQNTRRIDLQWDAPLGLKEESNFIPSLFFFGALYPDSLPQVPVLIYRTPLTVPHFTYEYVISDKVIQPASAEESLILEEAGFAQSEFVMVSDNETTRGETYGRVHVVPVRKTEGIFEKLISFTLKTSLVLDIATEQGAMHQYPDSSVLAKGEWYRVCVEKEGVFRLGHQELTDLGMNPSQINKSTLQIYGNGGGMLPEANNQFRHTDLQENAIWVSGSNSGSFTTNDFILFYGQSPHRWFYNENTDLFEHQVHHYSDETCYFITHGQQPGKRIESRSSIDQNPNHTVTSFYDYRHHQRDLVNIIGSGKGWFGELFDVTLTRDFDFTIPGMVQQQPVHITVNAAARSSLSSTFIIEAFGSSQTFNLASVNLSNVTGPHARQSTGSLSVLPQSDNFTVRLTYNRSVSGSRGWLNYITVNARRSLSKTGDQMFFRNPSSMGNGNISRFQVGNSSSGNRIWDVTDPLNIVQQQFQLTGNTASFTVNTDQLREFVVFGNEEFPKPRLAGAVANQNLHALQLHDMFIVVPDLLKAEAERLAAFRRDFNGLSVRIVSPRQIYNEFSSGVPDISAIRNFMKMFYDRGVETGEYPRYLMLFGNGTYDNKNILGYGGNLIPTFQTRESLNYANSYITDDFFGLLDDNEGWDAQGAIDLGIGRLPVRTVDEARFIVDKLLRYDQRIPGLEPGTDNPLFAGVTPNYADWRNVISLVADDEDANVHLSQTENLANYLAAEHPVLNVEKIYLDAYEQVTLAGGSRYPDVNKAINSRVNQGALLINYVGHGGTLGLAHERILTFDDILSWGNFYNLPVFMTATCEFSSFDQPDANDLSAGVRVFLKPDGGAVALFTTTRLAYSGSNFNLNDAFMRNAFVPMENGEMPRLGDLIRISKVKSSSASQLKNFVLLGDPSMQMAYPRYNVVTTEVPDTMRALEKVTVRGEVHMPGGGIATYYNGVLYPTIYDKKGRFSTLGNDPGSYVREFTMQNKILYRGTASVVDGQFEFSFIVPRDISYNSGFGKISYYVDDGELYDGHGYFDNFIISGTSDDYIPDHQGPEITLYLNNTNFRSGDQTGPDPVLLAYLKDDSGINTTGQIGHDIVAFLNNDTSNPYILNNFYQSDLDSYQSGRVVYPFFNLEKGDYTLMMRAWDVHNNVSTQSIDFVVTSAPGIILTELLNYPNPFSDRTQFSIEHNRPATELRILIEIFSLNGQLVKSIDENIYASGFNIPPIEWDGTDEGGTLLKNGIYIFRAFVSSADGDKVERTEKLMILR